MLFLPARSTADALALFGDRLAAFERCYVAALERVLACRLPTTVCTIYNGALEPAEAGLARVGLMMFNDVIVRAASQRRVGVIELRAVCTEPEDYVSGIEPSGRGGRKIAAAIARATGVIVAPAPSSIWT